MIFSEKQKEELREIIMYHINTLIANNIGIDALKQNDIKLLQKYDFDFSGVNKWPPYLQAFMFGRLAAFLSESQLNKLTYEDFKNYLVKKQYSQLSKREIEEYGIAKERAYSHIKNIGQKISFQLDQDIIEQDKIIFTTDEKIVAEKIKEGVLYRQSIKKIVTNIISKVENINVDWGRIVDTEMHDIYSRGKASSIAKERGVSQRVYKDTYPGACKWCIKLHLKSGIGSEPIIFTLEELYGNGSNVGLKPPEWKAVIGSTHPFCRCDLRIVPDYYEWDKKAKAYKIK